MKILLIADLHDLNYENLNKIDDIEFDICILLGDILKKYLDAIKSKIDISKIYGITGNHDTFNLLQTNGINDIDMKIINFDNLKIAGISGGVRYKRGMYAMLTQEEMNEKIKELDKCDILFSHETGYHYLRDDDAHQGFIAIDEYIKKYEPKYNIFGHYHINNSFQKYNTKCICIYQCALFDTEIDKIYNIF